MNYNFSAASMSHDILRLILELLSPPDLARSACVCRLWRSLASDRDLLENAFKKPWNVKHVVGIPSSTAFWRQPGLDRFAISHRLRRGDTVAGLALKYSVQIEKQRCSVLEMEKKRLFTERTRRMSKSLCYKITSSYGLELSDDVP